MSRIDYSKWDDLDCSESEEDEQTMLTKRIEKMSGKDIREVYEETHEEFFQTVSGNKISSSSSSSRDYSSSLATSDSPTPVWKLVTQQRSAKSAGIRGSGLVGIGRALVRRAV